MLVFIVTGLFTSAVFAQDLNQKVSLNAAANICKHSCIRTVGSAQVSNSERLTSSNANGLYPSQSELLGVCYQSCDATVKAYYPQFHGE